ncbi:MAG: guanylate kinase [Candidatus Omnitrophica bacterium]|nr:guanylate kinase [Candidatus Omnitrophota bacterium]
MSDQGRLFIISAPSGSGKTTLIQKWLAADSSVTRSISVTTRPQRRGEIQGRDYRFVSKARFERLARAGAFLERAKILGHWYGTPRGPLKTALRRGKSVLLCLDVQGARQVRTSRFPVTTVFLLPPSLKALRQRLVRRGTETGGQISARLKLARRELKEMGRFDYAVVNDRVGQALNRLRAIALAERCRVGRKENAGVS